MSQIYWIIGGCSVGGVLFITCITFIIYKCCKARKSKRELNVEAGTDAWQAHEQDISLEGEEGPLAKRHRDGLCKDTLTRTKLSFRLSIKSDVGWTTEQSEEGEALSQPQSEVTTDLDGERRDAAHTGFDMKSYEGDESFLEGYKDLGYGIETLKPEVSNTPEEIQQKYYSIKPWSTRKATKRSRSFNGTLDEGPSGNSRSLKRGNSLPHLLDDLDQISAAEGHKDLQEWRNSFKFPEPDYPGADQGDNADTEDNKSSSSSDDVFTDSVKGNCDHVSSSDVKVPVLGKQSLENLDDISQNELNKVHLTNEVVGKDEVSPLEYDPIVFNDGRNGYADPTDSGVDSEGYDALSRHGDDVEDDESPKISPRCIKTEEFNFHDLKKENVHVLSNFPLSNINDREKTLPVSLQIPYNSSNEVRDQTVVLHRVDSTSHRRKGILIESISMKPTTLPASPRYTENLVDESLVLKKNVVQQESSKGIAVDKIIRPGGNHREEPYKGESSKGLTAHVRGIRPDVDEVANTQKNLLEGPETGKAVQSETVTPAPQTNVHKGLSAHAKAEPVKLQASEEPTIAVSAGIQKFQEKGRFVPKSNHLAHNRAMSPINVTSSESEPLPTEDLGKPVAPQQNPSEIVNTESKTVLKAGSLGKQTSASIVAQTLKHRENTVQAGNSYHSTPEFGRIKLKSVPKVGDFRGHGQHQEVRNFGAQQHFGGPSRSVSFGVNDLPPYSKDSNKKLSEVQPAVVSPLANAGAIPATTNATATEPQINIPTAPPPPDVPSISRNASIRMTDEERARDQEEKRKSWKKDQVEQRIRGTLMVNQTSINMHASGLAYKSCMPELFTKIKQRSVSSEEGVVGSQ